MVGWKSDKLGQICDISIGGTPSRNNNLFWDEAKESGNLWVSISDLNTSVIYNTNEYITTLGVKNSNAKLVKRGNVLMSFKLSIGRVAFAGKDLYTNEAICTFDNLKIDKDYLYYGLQNWDLLKDVDNAIKGATLNKSKLDNIIAIFPSSLIEQRKIATILSTIDQNIAQTEQLITKYKNIKQGLMHDLLTYGIDENGIIRNPQTHTFVEKKGMMVPENWDVVEVGELADLKSGGTPYRENSTFWNGNIPWVKTGEVNYNLITETEEYITEKGLSSSSTFLFPRGTILIALYGQGKTRGRVAILDIDATTNQACLGFLNIRKVTTAFLYLSLSYEYGRLRDLSNEGAQKNLSGSLLKNFLLKIPLEISEQNKISEILQSQDNLIESEQTNLAKLQKLKQGLMQDLLTGKVRVKL